MDTDFDDMLLPLGSDNEELEDISKLKFRPLFDVSRFILKDEIRDNGIDIRIEILRQKKKLGFGANFQL